MGNNVSRSMMRSCHGHGGDRGIGDRANLAQQVPLTAEGHPEHWLNDAPQCSAGLLVAVFCMSHTGMSR